MAVFFKTGKIMRNSLHWMLDDGEQASTEAKHLVGMVGNGGGHYGCGGHSITAYVMNGEG